MKVVPGMDGDSSLSVQFCFRVSSYYSGFYQISFFHQESISQHTIAYNVTKYL